MSWIFSQAMVKDYVNSHSSPEQAVAFSQAIYLDGRQFAQLNGMLMPHAFLSNDKTKVSCHLSRYGMTSKPLTESHGKDLLMWYRGDFLAKIYQPRESEQGSMENAQECGGIWQGSLGRYDPDSHSLKTAQNSLIQDLTGCCVILPQWGSMRNGALYLLPAKVQTILESESGLLPTPRCSRGFTNPTKGKPRNDCITTKILGEPILGMRPNPRYIEWMMGIPIGWTELRGLETPKFHEWQQQHGGF